MPADRDLTEHYQSFLVDGAFQRAKVDVGFDSALRTLAEARIVIVPSWFGDAAFVADEVGLFDYWGEQVAALKAAGLDVELASTDTEASVASNGAALQDLIRRSARPLCFVSHSKGGLDVLDALIALNAVEREKVRCWIALQAPFAGSPLADLAVENPLIDVIASPVLSSLGGSEVSLHDLTVAERDAYMARHGAEVAVVVRQVPILSFASYLEGVEFRTLMSSVTGEILGWAADQELPNDGLVPLQSAVLPGSAFVVVEGLNHGMTVSGRSLVDDPEERVLLLKLLFHLVLDGVPKLAPI